MRLVVKEKDTVNQYLYRCVELNITDKKAVSAYLESNKIDIVVNCVAYTDIDKPGNDKEIADFINQARR